MLASNIPYLHCRNGIYYYRNQSTWKSLKTRCKKKAFNLLIDVLYGTMRGTVDKSTYLEVSYDAKASKPQSFSAVASFPKFGVLIKAYLNENRHSWCAREYTRIESSLKLLPKSNITKEVAIELKQSLLKDKTIQTFNRYLKYFNAFFRWVIANNADITNNPFDGLKVIEKKTSSASKRNAYTAEHLAELFRFSNKYGKDDIRYWLIMLGRYIGARMNEICQLKPEDITEEAI
ncbi:MAG: hypothetical protein HRT54_09085 [Colwellia sp.]|nr:hypothetical protein [Colwellia sp.]